MMVLTHPAALAADHTIEQLEVMYDAITGRVAARVPVEQRSGGPVREDQMKPTAQEKIALAAIDNAFEIRRAIDRGEVDAEQLRRSAAGGEEDDARQVTDQSERMTRAIDNATRQAGREVHTRQATALLAEFGQGLRQGVPQRIAVPAEGFTRELFTRSATVATTGETSVVSARSGRPPFIWSALAIPFERAASHKVEGPTWQPLVSQAGTAEGGTKPTMVDAVLDSQDLVAYGVVHTVSDKVVRFGVGEAAVAARLAAEAVFSVNGGIINRFETHGTEIAFVTDAPTSLDTAIAEVVSRTGGATGIILNAADYPAVAARSANSAQDVESGTIAGYNGLPLFMHPAMLAGHAIVVNGMWLSAHATDVLMASLPVLSTNEIDLRAEVYAAVLIGDASAVQRVDVSSAA